MPTYRFKNMTTGEEYDEFMSMGERENYLKTHPTIAQVPMPVAFVGDHIMGVGPKNDEGFKNKREAQLKGRNQLQNFSRCAKCHVLWHKLTD